MRKKQFDTARQKIAAALKGMQEEYRVAKDKELMQSLKLSTFDDLVEIFTSSSITPDAAPFVVGRLVQAFAPYQRKLLCIQKYEALEEKLADAAKIEDAIRRQVVQT